MIFNRNINITYNKNNFTQERSILILGKAENSYNRNKILKISTIDNATYNYGHSELTEALSEAILTGAKNLYACNCYTLSDYIDIVNLIAQYNFEFIVPLFLFSDFFCNINDKIMYLSEFYSNTLNENSNSFILVTDKHASLYENLDHYIEETNKLINNFKNNNDLTSGINLGFVANILKDYKYANVILATILANSNFKTYPQQDVGDVVFELNNFDFYGQEVIYFSKHDNTAIENLLSFYNEKDPKKIIPNQIICSRIENCFDLSAYKGKLYSAYDMIQIEAYINEIYTSFLDTSIESYTIDQINPSFNSDNTVDINISAEIKTYLSFEYLNMNLIF